MITLVKFVKMPVSSKITALRLAFFLICAEIYFAVMPAQITQKYFFKKIDLLKPRPDNELDLLRLQLGLLSAVCRLLPWNPGCIIKAVTLRNSLAMKGITSEIKVGVRSGKDKLEAHAWLECCGMEVLQYEHFIRLEPAIHERKDS